MSIPVPTDESDLELLALKRKKLELQRKKLDLMQNYGLAYYKPHAKQHAFHSACTRLGPDGKPIRHRLWESGNRSGKSTGGVAEDCSWLMGFRPFYGSNDPARIAGIPQDHPVKLLVITTDWDKVDEIFTSQRGDEGKLWRMLPRGFVKSTKRNHSGAIETVECVNGSILRFDTVKSWSVNPAGLESSDWDAIHVDEPCPKKMYDAAARGLMDRKGCSWFTLTPMEQPWIHAMFFPGRKSKDAISITNSRWGQRGSTRDNPHISEEAIADFVSGLKRDEIECRIDGIPLQLSGLVYKQFDYDRHVLDKPLLGWNSFSQPPQNATIYVAMDVHPQTPHHVMFLAVLPFDISVIYDEIFVHCAPSELARQILAKTAGRFLIRTICDPLAFIQHPETGLSMADTFAANGLYVGKASKARAQGILQGQEWLLRKSGIYVSPECEETISEFANHAWDTRENKPRDEDDHAMENFGRLAIERPRWVDPEQQPVILPDLDFGGSPELGELPDINPQSELDY